MSRSKRSAAPLAKLAALALRDLLGSPRGSLCLVAVIALSVTANTAIRVTSDDFVTTLGNIPRAGIAGDLSVELHATPEPAEVEALNETGAKWTLITSLMYPVRSVETADPIPAAIKAVDPKVYPLYGELRLIPPQPLARALNGRSAVISSELLHELGLRVGGFFTINGLSCRITAVIDREPDRFAGALAGPLRAIISLETLQRTGILRSSAPTLYRFAVAVPSSKNLGRMRMRLGQIFADGNVFGTDDSASPELDAAKSVSEYLDVLAWFALALGAGGGLVAAQLHVRSRLDTLATLKCLGISNFGAIFWLAIELLLLGAAGALMGCGAGLLVRDPLLRIAGIDSATSIQGLDRLVFEAMLVGIALPEILGIAWVLPAVWQRPALLFRREKGWGSSRRATSVRAVIAWLGFCGLAIFLSRTPPGSTLLLLAAFAAAILALYKFFDLGFYGFQRAVHKYVTGKLPMSFRFAVRDFLRVESMNGVVTDIAAFVALFTIVAALGQRIVVREVVRSLPMSRASIYLMAVPQRELAGVRFLLDRHPEIHKPYDIRSFVWFHVRGNNSWGATSTSLLSSPLSMVACSTELQPVSGITLDTTTARRFGVHRGSKLTFLDINGEKIEARVGTIRDLPPTERAWSSIVVPCAGLNSRGMFHHIGLELPDRDIPPLVRDLRAVYPALTLVRPQEIFAEVQNIVETGAALVKFLCAITISVGLLVGASLVFASARQRREEIAILQTLGATRSYILRIMMIEFAVLGSAAALLGGLASILLIDLLLTVALGTPILDPHVLGLGLAMLAGIGLGAVAGGLSCVRVVRRRPFVILRQA